MNYIGLDLPALKNELPFISVIIPTLNESEYITQTLQQLHDQTYPKHRMEIIVVDGGSTDETQDIVTEWINTSFLNIKILTNSKRISSSARNIGISAARGEYVLFVDAHVFIPSNQLLENMGRAACANHALVLGRPQPLNPPKLTSFQAVVASVRGSKLGHSIKSFIYSDIEGWVNPVSIGVMYHISLFDTVGCFDESFDAAEDVDFNFRLACEGYKAYISPDFTVLYYPRKNIVGLAKQLFRYGVGRARFTWKHSRSFWLELLVPLGMLCVFLVLGFCLAVSGVVTLCLLLGLLLYLFAFLILFRLFSRVTHMLLAPVVLLTIHLSLAIGLIAGFAECVVTRKLSGKPYAE